MASHIQIITFRFQVYMEVAKIIGLKWSAPNHRTFSSIHYFHLDHSMTGELLTMISEQKEAKRTYFKEGNVNWKWYLKFTQCHISFKNVKKILCSWLVEISSLTVARQLQLMSRWQNHQHNIYSVTKKNVLKSNSKTLSWNRMLFFHIE